MVDPDKALPGRDRQMPVAPVNIVTGNPMTPPFPDGLETAVFGLGCFWGAERKFWETPGVWSTAVGYAGGYTPNPTYEEACSGRTGHAEVVLVGLRPEAGHLRAVAQGVLGVARSNARHAPRQRRRHPVPLRHLVHERRAEGGGRVVTRHVPGGAKRQGLRRDHHRDRRGRSVLSTPRTTTSSTSRRTRTATAASAAPASSAPSASLASKASNSARRSASEVSPHNFEARLRV